VRYLLFISILLLLAGCRKDAPVLPETPDRPFELQLPPGFPTMPVPDDNELTYDRVELGKRLFFDKQLSVDHSVSCATCHDPARSFADENPISIGVGGAVGLRNSPSLANVGYQQALFAEGGVPSLELQALAPIIEPHEMNLGFLELIERLNADESYVELFQRAYGSQADTEFIVKALASFQRTLISGQSRYDQYHFQGMQQALNASEIRGMELFFSDEVGCASCHSGFLFTNQKFENVGLYTDYTDEGVARLTNDPADIGRFKVPSLRNVEVTAPYMHNGSISTLEEVVEHFNNGGAGHPNQSEWVKPLDLSEQDRADLVNFMHSLTDEAFLMNPAFQ